MTEAEKERHQETHIQRAKDRCSGKEKEKDVQAER